MEAVKTVEAEKLFQENMGLVYYALQNINPVPPFSWDDLAQEGFIGLWKAVNNYDPAKGRFSTIAMKMIKNSIFSVMRPLRTQKRDYNNLLSGDNSSALENYSASADPTFDSVYKDDLLESLYKEIERIWGQDYVTIFQKYLEGKTQKEIAAEENLAQPIITNRIKKCRQVAARMLQA